MKKKSLIDLLKLLKEEYQRQVASSNPYPCLCDSAGFLRSKRGNIEMEEVEYLEKYIEHNKPNNAGNRLFWFSKMDSKNATRSKKNIQKRLDWLDAQIELPNE